MTTVRRPVVTAAEAATILGVTRQTVYALIERGDLRRYKVGRLTRIPTSDVLALVGCDDPCDPDDVEPVATRERPTVPAPHFVEQGDARS